jgi:hypothetical protein
MDIYIPTQKNNENFGTLLVPKRLDYSLFYGLTKMGVQNHCKVNLLRTIYFNITPQS